MKIKGPCIQKIEKKKVCFIPTLMEAKERKRQKDKMEKNIIVLFLHLWKRRTKERQKENKIAKYDCFIPMLMEGQERKKDKRKTK